jgi:cytochrome c biogenesis protein
MTLRQLPGFAFRSPTDYANEMAKLHDLYDASLGTAVVDGLERLQLFHVFSSTWFSIGLVVLIISIVACTIDRTPRLWRQSADIRVVQPDPYFDPKLPDRAVMAGISADAAASVLRRHRFVVRREEAGGATYLYGDRNRWTKLATLLTHTGLVLFLVAAAITSRLGDEQGLVVAEGESLTVQPIGTPGLLLVRNLGFDAPGFDTGRPTDFTTHLAVYQDGRQIAEKTIRVNDPLTVGGYTFHQNGFGPAPDVVIRDAEGRPLWDGPIPMTDAAAGFPFAEFAVPGRDVVLQLLLQRATDGTGVLLVLPFRQTGVNPDGSPVITGLEPLALTRGESDTAGGTDFSVELSSFGEFTLLIAKKDPGQGIVWGRSGS